MMPSVIRVLCLKLCSLRNKAAAEKAGRTLRAAATSTSSPKETGDNARHAMRQGVQLYRSRNGVVLTSDRIPPASILHYESLRDHQKYDRRGNPM